MDANQFLQKLIEASTTTTTTATTEINTTQLNAIKIDHLIITIVACVLTIIAIIITLGCLIQILICCNKKKAERFNITKFSKKVPISSNEIISISDRYCSYIS